MLSMDTPSREVLQEEEAITSQVWQHWCQAQGSPSGMPQEAAGSLQAQEEGLPGVWQLPLC